MTSKRASRAASRSERHRVQQRLRMASTTRAKEGEGARRQAGDGGAAPKRLAREYFESALVTLVMALFFMTFVAQAAAVPSASMQNTIFVGDHFLINKFVFAPGPRAPFLPQRDIRRGDVVVFKYPGKSEGEVVQYETLFIKRVVGLPGETIEVHGPDVLINGEVLSEHKVAADYRVKDAPLEVRRAPPRHDEKPYTVFYRPETFDRPAGESEDRSYYRYAVGRPFRIPDDSYFVMGDNRDDSADSRVWGPVRRDLVVGRAMFVIWSYDESAPSHGNFFIDFFANTRWRRTGTLIK